MLYRLRPFLFWLFVSAFFITAASVIFYAFGYRFSLDRGIFIYTGSITIKSTPETVTVSINGETVPQKRLGLLNQSIHLAGLPPGEHFIEVSAPGYRTWAKKAVVQSGVSTEFWNVLLLRENYAPDIFSETAGAVKMFASPENGLYAVMKKNGENYSLVTFDSDTGKTEEIFSTKEYSFSPDDTENIEWSPESDKLLVPLTRDGLRTYFVVEVRTKKAMALEELIRFNAPRTGTIRVARWDPANRNTLFFLEGTTLYRVNTEEALPAPTLVREKVETYDLSARNIYYISSDSGTVYRLPSSGRGDSPVQIASSAVPVSLETRVPYTLVIYDEDRYTIIDHTKGSLSVFNRDTDGNPLKLLSTGIVGSQFSDDGKKLLYWSDNDISAYFLADWEVQPLREADTVIQIARFSSPIRNVQWSEDYEHIVFTLHGNIKLIELDNRDRRILTDILSFPEPLLQVLSHFGENRLYVVPQSGSIQSIVFPETPGIFGIRN